MKLGYIVKTLDEKGNEIFKLKEADFKRKQEYKNETLIKDKVYAKILSIPWDYDDIEGTTRMMKDTPSLIIVQEPFFLDDELRERIEKWIEWFNQADPSEGDD